MQGETHRGECVPMSRLRHGGLHDAQVPGQARLRRTQARKRQAHPRPRPSPPPRRVLSPRGRLRRALGSAKAATRPRREREPRARDRRREGGVRRVRQELPAHRRAHRARGVGAPGARGGDAREGDGVGARGGRRVRGAANTSPMSRRSWITWRGCTSAEGAGRGGRRYGRRPRLSAT